MHLRVARDRKNRVSGLFAGGRDRSGDHGDFKPRPTHAFDGSHQIDIGDVRIDVAAIHHREIHAVVTDLLRNHAQLRIGHLDQILREGADHRGGARPLHNTRFRSAILFGGELRAGIAAEEGGCSQRGDGVPPGHRRLSSAIPGSPNRETMTIITSIVWQRSAYFGLPFSSPDPSSSCGARRDSAPFWARIVRSRR